MSSLKQLHTWYADRVQFVDIFLHQAHPGERRGAYRSYEEKQAGAREFKRDEGISWPVLVDDLAGTVHNAYGGMADPVYLIDSAGRVAFYGMWSSMPKLKQAIDELLAHGGQGGPVAGGIDQTPHLLASFVDGWRGISRGGLRAALDYELGAPGSGTLTFLGNLAKPVLAPIALRTTPLPTEAKLALGGGLAALALAVWAWRRGD